ncbi:MAG TPA: hypothetical protein VK589_21400 [Chryseolinea sp.]|nr:hypothetical protein [Chryseolinea sp.]
MKPLVVVVLIVVGLFIILRIFKAILKWILIAIVVVVAIAYFSNPDESNHKRSLKEIGQKLDIKIKDDAIQVDDYKIFSVTKVKVDGKETITGIGAFGKVWHFDDLKDHFDK